MINILFICDNSFSRKKGLNDVTELNENDGIIFIFPNEYIYNFTNKDINYDIGVLYFNSKFELNGYDYVNADQKSFKPKKECKYVIECNPSILQKYNFENKLLLTDFISEKIFNITKNRILTKEDKNKSKLNKLLSEIKW